MHKVFTRLNTDAYVFSHFRFIGLGWVFSHWVSDFICVWTLPLLLCCKKKKKLSLISAGGQTSEELRETLEVAEVRKKKKEEENSAVPSRRTGCVGRRRAFSFTWDTRKKRKLSLSLRLWHLTHPQLSMYSTLQNFHWSLFVLLFF